jgi:hypothetical protein
MDNYRTEKLKQYLVGLGVQYKDVDAVISNYTRDIMMDSYNKGFSRCKRINQACRIFNRNLAINDFEEFYNRWVNTVSIDMLHEFQNMYYDNLPIIS